METNAGRARSIARESFGDATAVIRNRWWVIIASALIGSSLALGFSLAKTPEYVSTATLYVTSGAASDSSNAYQGSLASEQRVRSYVELATSDAVLSQVREAVDAPVSTRDLIDSIDVTAGTETVLLRVNVRDSDSSRAALIANSVARAMSEYVSTLERPTDGGAPLAKLTLVTPASPSSKPASPRVKRDVALAFVACAFLATVGVLAHARFSTRIVDPESLSSRMGCPVLGEIPSDRDLGDKTVDFSSGWSDSAEEYRKLRANLGFVRIDDAIRTLLITSPNQGEGKSTTALNLAAAYAEAGKKVLLVDADLRRPRVSHMLGLNGDIGLTDLLRNDSTLGEVIQHGAPNLSVLASGGLPPNPSEMLASDRVARVLAEASEIFDLVIVDTAPLLPVADGSIVAQVVDAVLVVVRSGLTRFSEVADAFKVLELAKVAPVGLVLNDTKNDTNGRYVYQYVSDVGDRGRS